MFAGEERHCLHCGKTFHGGCVETGQWTCFNCLEKGHYDIRMGECPPCKGSPGHSRWLKKGPAEWEADSVIKALGEMEKDPDYLDYLIDKAKKEEL